MASRFVTEYTESLAVIPASRSATQDSEKEQMTPDTFSRIYASTFVQLDLFGVSSRTSVDTSTWDSMKFTKAFEIWVTKLRQDCLQRQKLAHLTRESDCSSWGTPRDCDYKGGDRKDETKWSLTEQVNNWPTVRASEYKGTGPKGSKSHRHMQEKHYLCAVVEDGQPDQDKSNTNGSSRGQLNPAWVEQLMGLPQGWTNFDCSEME
jgi:hypothetical protein